MAIKQFLRGGGWLILLFGLAACLPTESQAPPTHTAVPPTSTNELTLTATVTVTAVPATATREPTAMATATPMPPTRLPTSTPSPTVAVPQTSGLFERVAILPATFAGPITDFRLLPNDTNSLQLVTTAGYFRIDLTDGQAVTWPALPETTVIGVDEAGVMWLMRTDDNTTIYALDPSGVTTAFGPEAGWLPPVARPGNLLQDANGHVWLITGEDVRQFDGTRWTIYAREDLGMSPPAQEDLGVQFQLAYAPFTQTVWVGECDWGGPGPYGGGGARWFDGSTWQGADAPAARGCVTEIVEAMDGRIWIALNNHLWQFNPADSSWQQFIPPATFNDLSIGYTEKLFVDHAGNPWPLFSLCGGASCQVAYALYRLRDGEWTAIGDANNLLDAVPIGVFSSDNLPFFFTNGKMIAYTQTDETIIFESFALSVGGVAIDEADNIWLVGRPSPDLPLAIWHTHLDD